MQPQTSSITVIAIGTLIAAGVFGWTLVHAVLYAPEQSGPLPPQAQTAQTPELYTSATSTHPDRLVIPSLNINAAIQYVGVNAEGNMRAPDNFTDVAWYEYGTIPGMRGSAVIDGHVDNGLGLDGVFKHLTDIKVGEDVYVRTKGGTKLHFAVFDIETYPYQGVPVQKLFMPNDAAYLNLITCEGLWVWGGDTYDHRLVVYTRLVSS